MLKLIEGFDWLPVSGDESLISTRMAKSRWYFSGYETLETTNTSAFSYGRSFFSNNTVAQFDTQLRMHYPVDNQTEGYMGARVRLTANHSGYTSLSFYDGINGAAQITIQCSNTGIINVWRGSPRSGTLLAQSAVARFYEDTWFYLEAYCKIGNTNGQVQVRVNTVPVISLVDVDTQSTSRSVFDMVGLMDAPASSQSVWTEQIYFDDIYFCDPTGSVNNGFLGNVRVKTAATIGAGAFTDFLIGGSAPAATNWQSVQNAALDDTKYVYSPTVGQKDTYQMDPIINAPFVHGISVRNGLRQDDATQRVARAILRTNLGTIVEGPDIYLNQSYAVDRTIFETNPDTGVFFTGAEANLVQAGTKVQV